MINLPNVPRTLYFISAWPGRVLFGGLRPVPLSGDFTLGYSISPPDDGRSSWSREAFGLADVSDLLRDGQSCFIGHYKTNSLEGSSVRGLQSPYHGCAPGIWTWKYPGGAVLGPSETALVVADVNPVDTNASKPARQIETLPLSLVAHIPFFLGAESGGKDDVQERAVKSAQEILAYLTPPDASLAAASPLSTCETDLATAHVARGIAERLAQVDKRCEDSLRLRAGGLRIASMQPHAHPGIPALLDWAFIAAPTNGVQIEVPEIEAVEA